jgi:uncharacterized protein GlcG (DUF336 family)
MAQTRTTHALTLEAARKAATAAEAEARRQGWEMSIAIVDPSGTLLHFMRMDSAPASSVTSPSARPAPPRAFAARASRSPTRSPQDARAWSAPRGC